MLSLEFKPVSATIISVVRSLHFSENPIVQHRISVNQSSTF